jgi:branched-chain amino acid transport system permease protein
MARRTRFGRSWRALKPRTAALVGVDPRRLIAATFLLAGCWPAQAGSSPPITATSRIDGRMPRLKALVAAVVGNIGSVPGAFLGESAWR